MNAISGELRPVKSCLRKAAEQRGKRLGSDRARFSWRDILQLLRQQRSAGDGRRTTATEEASLRDSSRFDARRKLQDIPANWIADFDRCCGT